MIREASEQDIPQLKQLFKVCFGDTDAFLNIFFTEYFPNTTCMVAIRDERIVSMLFLCPAKMVADEYRRLIYYVYACGTLPEYRRKGIMEQLLQVSHAFAKQQDAWGLILVPAGEHLASYYLRLGFSPFSHNVKEKMTPIAYDEEIEILKPCELSLKQITYIRNRQFKGEYQVLWSQKHIAFSIAMLEQQGGGSLGLQWKNGRKDYVIYEKKKNELIVKETSVEENILPWLTPLLCKHFDVGSVKYIVPAKEGDPFSMIKPIDPFEIPDNILPYFNLEMG
jgi:Predicted acetyltransferase involved in intracellular survival and related acetyltransferases